MRSLAGFVWMVGLSALIMACGTSSGGNGETSSEADASGDVAPDCAPLCGADETCVEGACVECVGDEDCDLGDRCEDKACVERACDPDCDAGAHCELLGDVPTCVDDACDPACGDCQACVAGDCVLSDCAETCGEGLSCECVEDVMTCVANDCTEPCGVDEHCAGDKQCQPNVCDPLCGESCYCGAHEGSAADCVCDCDPPCAEDEFCNEELMCEALPCESAQDCEEGQRCEQGACVETECDPECALGEACTWNEAEDMADCVEWICDPACAAYEYCDEATPGSGETHCLGHLCDPLCPRAQHCVAGDTCVDNDCDPMCDTTEFYCDKDQACVAICDCSEQPSDPICGEVDAGGGSPFQIFDNDCELDCADAVPADCASLPVQPVCDVESYVVGQEAEHSYDNSCFAACAGVPTGDLMPGDCGCELTCTPEELESGQVCSHDCVTYDNQCAASCAGVAVQYSYACEEIPSCLTCSPCDLESFLDPVCGTDGNTYVSACDLLTCHPGEDLDIEHHGDCIDICPCQKPGAADTPVCASNPEGSWQTYATTCVANCKGEDIYYDWICDPDCDPTPEIPMCAYNYVTSGWEDLRNSCEFDALELIYDNLYAGECVCCGAGPGGCCDMSVALPVCGVDGVTYSNECAMQCAGVGKANDGECACPSTFDPVCGESTYESGKQYTYGNECVAKSVYAVTTYTAGACTVCQNACSGVPSSPVCGLDGVSYPDICHYLNCNGDTIILGIDDTACSGTCPCP